MGCCTEKPHPRILFTCSGCCTEGEISDKIGRQLRQNGYARCGGSCLAGVSAGYPRFINAIKDASEVVSIDGCPMTCAKRTLEKASFHPRSFVLTSMGLAEGCNPQEFIAAACRKIHSTTE